MQTSALLLILSIMLVSDGKDQTWSGNSLDKMKNFALYHYSPMGAISRHCAGRTHLFLSEWKCVYQLFTQSVINDATVTSQGPKTLSHPAKNRLFFFCIILCSIAARLWYSPSGVLLLQLSLGRFIHWTPGSLEEIQMKARPHPPPPPPHTNCQCFWSEIFWRLWTKKNKWTHRVRKGHNFDF